MHLDITKLTDQEQQTVRMWEGLFDHPGWQLLLQKFEPLADGVIGMYRAAETELALGYVRGRDDVLEGIVKLETIIETEFNQIVQARSQPADLDI